MKLCTLSLLMAMALPCIAHGEDVLGDIYQHMQYLSKRDKIIAQNIQNADTPGYKPQELYKRRKQDEVVMVMTHAGHMNLDDEPGGFFVDEGDISEVKPNGNAVSLDEELYRKGENATKLGEAANVYAKAKSMLNTAIVGPK
jgi:flagellar basal-body rod protein FlgB